MVGLAADRSRPEQSKGEKALLNSRDIAALNRARDVLKRVDEAAWRRSLSHFDPYAPVSAWDLGRLSEAASIAEDAIFHVLTTARTHCEVKVTDAQLAGTEPGQADADKPADATRPVDSVPPEEASPTNGVNISRSSASPT